MDTPDAYLRIEDYISLAVARVRAKGGTVAEEEQAVLNATRNFYRDAAVEKREERKTVPLDSLLDEPVCFRPGPEDIVSTADQVRHLMSRLPQHERHALARRALEDATYFDIGAELGISPKSVDKLLQKARDRLRDVPM